MVESKRRHFHKEEEQRPLITQRGEGSKGGRDHPSTPCRTPASSASQAQKLPSGPRTFAPVISLRGLISPSCFFLISYVSAWLSPLWGDFSRPLIPKNHFPLSPTNTLGTLSFFFFPMCHSLAEALCACLVNAIPDTMRKGPLFISFVMVSPVVGLVQARRCSRRKR